LLLLSSSIGGTGSAPVGGSPSWSLVNSWLRVALSNRLLMLSSSAIVEYSFVYFVTIFGSHRCETTGSKGIRGSSQNLKITTQPAGTIALPSNHSLQLD
jgi:hypothetical protein